MWKILPNLPLPQQSDPPVYEVQGSFRLIGSPQQIPTVKSFRSTSCPSIEPSSLRVDDLHDNPAIEKYHRIIKQQQKISRVAYHVEDTSKFTIATTITSWVHWV